MRGWRLLVAPMLLVAAPVLGAAPTHVAGTLTLHAPPDAAGALGVVSDVAGVDLAPDGRARGAPELAWARAEGTLHENAWVRAAGVTVSMPPSSRSETPIALPAGRLTRIECGAACQVLLFSTGEGVLRVDAIVEGPLAFAPESLRYWAEFDDDVDGAFSHPFPAGSLLLGLEPSATGNATASGQQFLFARDARLHVETADGPRAIDATSTREDVAPSGGFTSTQSRFALIRLHEALLRAPLSDVLVVAPEADATLDGRLEARNASGTLVVDGATHALDHGSLEIDGSIRILLAASEAPARRPAPLSAPPADPVVRIEAQAREAWIDGRLQEGPPRVEAAASAVAVLLALLLIAARLALPLYSRISRDRVLSNDNRRRLWDQLSAKPGQTVTALARATGISRVVVRHHVALLAAYGLVLRVARGRRKLYFPTGQAPAPDALAVQDALSDRSRLLVAQAVARAPTHATQADVARATGLSPRVVSYHLAHLQRQGLVHAEGSWRRTYRATPRLAAPLERASEATRRETA